MAQTGGSLLHPLSVYSKAKAAVHHQIDPSEMKAQ
jgi:hypothetical protein